MKHALTLTVLAISAITTGHAAAQDVNCDDAGSLTQQEMNVCAFRDWEAADRTLNAIWPEVRAWAEQTDTFAREWNPDIAVAAESLLKAQRAWIDYRDGHCDTEGMKFAGGSIQPLIVHSCRANLTRKRTEELRMLLEEG